MRFTAVGGIERTFLDIQQLSSAPLEAFTVHRVVLCSYFRKITVHDTNPEMFKLFLQYLYSGQFDTSELSTEQLADMITLADRYEVRH